LSTVMNWTLWGEVSGGGGLVDVAGCAQVEMQVMSVRAVSQRVLFITQTSFSTVPYVAFVIPLVK
jgi:hypothetical protein